MLESWGCGLDTRAAYTRVLRYSLCYYYILEHLLQYVVKVKVKVYVAYNIYGRTNVLKESK